MSGDLTDFELDVLEQLAGHRDDIPWGAAVGVAIETLIGHDMAGQRGRAVFVTGPGWARLAQRGTKKEMNHDQS